MSTITMMLGTLNALRAARNEPPLKAWKQSAAALEAKIAEYSPALEAPAAEAPRAVISVAAYARANNIDPKIMRSFLRRHFATPPNGWMATDDVIAKWESRRVLATRSAS